MCDVMQRHHNILLLLRSLLATELCYLTIDAKAVSKSKRFFFANKFVNSFHSTGLYSFISESIFYGNQPADNLQFDRVNTKSYR